MKKRNVSFPVFDIDIINATDEELLKISKDLGRVKKAYTGANDPVNANNIEN